MKSYSTINTQNGETSAGLVSSSFFNQSAIPLLRFISAFSKVQFRKIGDTVLSESGASLTHYLPLGGLIHTSIG